MIPSRHLGPLAGLASVMVVAVLAASPALAFTPDRAALMVDAVRANGCALRGDQAEAALGPLGLDGVEVQAFVDTLFGADLVTVSDDLQTLTLSEPLCAAEGEASLALITAAFEAQELSLEPWRPDFTAERGAEFVAAVRGAGCTLTEETAAQVLPAAGFSPDDSRDVVTVLIDGGLGEVSADAQSFGLTEAFCAADPAGDLAAVAAILDGWDASRPEVIIQRGADQ